MTHRQLTDDDLSTLANICTAAADRYADHAAAFRAVIDAPPARPGEFFVVRGDAALRMAEQFERQKDAAMNFGEMFSEASIAQIITEQDPEPGH